MAATGEEDDLEALLAHIPSHHPTTTTASEVVKCCCGRTDCAFLKHNCSALDDLEKEVRTAAQLGQVRTFCVARDGFCPTSANRRVFWVEIMDTLRGVELYSLCWQEDLVSLLLA